MGAIKALGDQEVHFSVDEAAARLKLCYVIERELLRMLGGYLPSIEDWGLKKTVSLHIWEDSLRADFARSRILELRFPRRDVEARNDEERELMADIQYALGCTCDAEFIAGVYLVWKSALLEFYKQHAERTNPLNDEPTIYHLRRYIPDLERQMAEMDNDLRRLVNEKKELNPQPMEWQAENQAKLGKYRLLFRKEPKSDSPQPVLAQERASYTPPAVPVRDSRFTPTSQHILGGTIQQQGDSFDELLEKNLLQGISHANEMWAAESLGVVMWAWDDMPWEFYMDGARWLYDESRHCRMGEERMRRMGFEAGVDYPMAAEAYAVLFPHGYEHLLGLLHYFEYMNTKQASKEWFETSGDYVMAENMDYDWADEAIHLSYGFKWLLHRLKGDMELMEQIRDKSFVIWDEWVAQNIAPTPIFVEFRKRMLRVIKDNKLAQR